MKKLYYSTCSCSAPHIGVILDDVLDSLDKSDEVYWAYCHCALSSCWVNRSGNRRQCDICHLMYNEYHRNYVQKVRMLPIKYRHITHQKRDIKISSSKDIRDFEYRGVNIGLSILSTYYSFTRDLDLVDFEDFKAYCIPLMSEICDMVDYCYQMLDEIKPDEVIIFNGRHFSNRFLYDICKLQKIPFKSLEVLGNFNDPPFKKISFKNNLPHSIHLRNEKLATLWAKSTDSLEKRKEIADNFYSKRRNGDLIADVKAYVSNQEKGLLPQGFDKQNRNIAIFNSSADEMAAIGGEWDEDILFDSQYDTIKFVLENSPKDIHYYLRIHPNLAGINHKAHMDLYKLAKFDNLTIIGPTDKISTYTLMDECEKTMTFGSTMGIESCYWGKPSILIGHAGYEMLNVCYIPKNKSELIELISDKDLVAKPNDDAIKYAYFILDRKFLAEPLHIDINIEHKHFIRDYISASYLKIFGSTLIYHIINLFYIGGCTKIAKIFGATKKSVYTR